jgi:hypothetical protein
LKQIFDGCGGHQSTAVGKIKALNHSSLSNDDDIQWIGHTFDPAPGQDPVVGMESAPR